MIIISHRGNINGPASPMENTNGQIAQALLLGFAVEIDVWGMNGYLYLGHDKPGTERIMLRDHRLWFHCKNIEALMICRNEFMQSGIKYFFHNNDDFTLTNFGHIWTYPGKEITELSIAVLPESIPDWDVSKAFGICTDYPFNYIP